MVDFTEALNWRLLSGSHEWPGPKGGTCINEAAIVVAGLPYKSVGGIADLPPCFSSVIGGYLIKLNDQMSDDARQHLIEFAPRLSGSADTAAIERQRLEYIVVQTVNRIVSMAMDAAGLSLLAAACRAAKTFVEAKSAAADAAYAAYTANAAYAAYAAKAAKAAYAAKAANAAIDQHCVEIVRGALAIGNQADPIEGDVIIARAAAIRAMACAR